MSPNAPVLLCLNKSDLKPSIDLHQGICVICGQEVAYSDNINHAILICNHCAEHITDFHTDELIMLREQTDPINLFQGAS